MADLEKMRRLAMTESNPELAANYAMRYATALEKAAGQGALRKERKFYELTQRDVGKATRAPFRKGMIDMGKRADKSLGNALSAISDAEDAIGGEGFSDEVGMKNSLAQCRNSIAKIRQSIRDELKAKG